MLIEISKSPNITNATSLEHSQELLIHYRLWSEARTCLEHSTKLSKTINMWRTPQWTASQPFFLYQIHRSDNMLGPSNSSM